MQENKQINSIIKRNILSYLEYKGISQYQCYKDTGITRGVLSQDNGISEDNLMRFLNYYCDVSPDWLLTGQGEMLRKVPAVASFDYSIQRNQPEVKTINTPKTKEPTEELQYIPYYSFEATAGVIELVDTSAEYEIGKIVVPNMPKCDGAVAVTGDSMYPLLKSGDIVAFKLVHDINNIHYGDMYLISLNEDGDCYITVKWLQKHPSDPSKAILVSHNEHYAPREVELRHIHRLALIKLSIRYNSMG
ncbi:XRE family transcriptional regulator [Porphyromonas levii]|uniref:XRE family transcriptional regulator n=1 Tax=Porphyromonas levii TaxID=28114 RepID=UPI000368BF97|nr:S24 family peptidase [Porphyromonas levii]